jgi:hypothetical protein
VDVARAETGSSKKVTIARSESVNARVVQSALKFSF